MPPEKLQGSRTEVDQEEDSPIFRSLFKLKASIEELRYGIRSLIDSLDDYSLNTPSQTGITESGKEQEEKSNIEVYIDGLSREVDILREQVNLAREDFRG